MENVAIVGIIGLVAIVAMSLNKSFRIETKGKSYRMRVEKDEES